MKWAARGHCIDALRPGQNGGHFLDNIFNCVFLNENVWILINIPLKFVPKCKLTIFHHWFRQWLGAGCATSQSLNQWWVIYWRIYVSLGLNSYHVEFISGKKYIYFHFLSFYINAEMTQVVGILPCGRQGLVNSTKLIPWLLMTWKQ